MMIFIDRIIIMTVIITNIIITVEYFLQRSLPTFKNDQQQQYNALFLQPCHNEQCVI